VRRTLPFPGSLCRAPPPGTLTPGDYVDAQPADLPVLVDHDTDFRAGAALYLERRASSGLLVVAQVRADLADYLDEHGPWFCSPSFHVTKRNTISSTSAHLDEIFLVRSPASLGLQPCRFSRHDLRLDGGGAPAGIPTAWHNTWARAHTAMSSPTRRRAAHLDIVDVDVDELLARPRHRAAPPSTSRPFTLTRAAAASTADDLGAGGYAFDSPSGRVRVHSAGYIVGGLRTGRVINR